MDAVIEDMHRAVVTGKDDRNRRRRRQLILKGADEKRTTHKVALFVWVIHNYQICNL